MEVRDALTTLVPFAHPDGFDADAMLRWVASSESAVDVLLALRRGLIQGELTPSFWQRVSSAR